MGKTEYEIEHFSHIAQDLRFYAEQRFKVVGVFMLTQGFLANVATSRTSVALAVLGIVLSYFCWSWEMRTTQWWRQLYESFKRIEESLGDASTKVYSAYPNKAPAIFVKATTAVRGIYITGVVAWLVYGVWSFPDLW